MRKLLALLILPIMLMSLLVGCQTFRNPNVLYEDELSEELKTTIKNKVVLKYDTSVQWGFTGSGKAYYGTINNCIVFQTSYPNAMWPAIVYNVQHEIAGYSFRGAYPDFNLGVYRDGEVCFLDEAYENGWLTKEQIGKIYEKHQIIYETYLKAYEESHKQGN